MSGTRGRFDHLHGNRNIRVWTYRPEGTTEDAPVVFVLHGVLRNGEEYRKPWIPIADRTGCIVYVPEFSKEAWPEARSYNFGNVRDADGHAQPREQWSYGAIDALHPGRYFIFGHSAGSQFVHRMAMLWPEARFEAAVTANAGSYAMPDFNVTWPYGLKDAPVDADGLRRVLQRRIVVQLGDQDSDPEGEHLPTNPEAMAQGPHRLARGKAFFEAGRARAAEFGVPFGWELQIVAGVGHDNARMAPAAAELLLPGPTRSPGA